MVFFHAPDYDHPACAKSEHLELVDAAFVRPGGPAAQVMRDTLCAVCPAAQQCFTDAMTRGEPGIWGGTSSNQRTRHGGARVRIRTSKIA